MKKGTKIAALLLGLALVIPACTPAGGKSSTPVEPSSEPTSEPASVPDSQPVTPSSEAPVNYTVTISNKTDLQAEWFAGDPSRKVEIAIEPRANISQLISEGKIEITSSNPQVLSITGQMANPVAAGEATIKVKCGASEDTVAVTLKAKQSVKEKYGVAHEGTAEDPFDNEDAIAVAKNEKYNNEDFYVKGEVASFYHAPGSRTDGAVSWYLKPADGKTEKFEIYKCYKQGSGEASYLTDDDIWVGGIATAHGTFTVYNSTQAETTSATFVKCEGNKPQPRQTLEKTFAETLALGQALPDGGDSYDYIKFVGFVAAKEGNNFWLTATKGEALVKGKSDEAHGNRDIYTNGIELYNAGKVAELVAKLLEGAEVEVTMLVKNYHGTVENGLDLKDENVVVKTAGTQWAVPEPAVGSATVTEFIALENTKAKAYNVKATVKSWKNADAAKDKYGNMVLTDGTSDLTIYGASATATALAWDNSSAYAFTNPQDFLTNEVTAALNIGDEVTMKLIRADYNGAVQGTGIITKVVPAGQQPVGTTLEFSLAKYATDNSVASGTQVKTIAADSVVTLNAVGTDSNTGKIYIGTDYTEWRFYKSGTGTLEIVLAAGYELVSAKGQIGTANYGAPSEVEFTIADNKVSYNPGANFNVKSLEIVYKAAGETPAPANAYPTFKWSDAIQDGSAALDGTKFNKNATYNLKVENVPAAGNYTITLPMMGSDGNASRTFCTSGTSHDGQGFTISANGVDGQVLIAEKTYEEVFGADQKAWVDVLFGQVALVEGTNTIVIKTNGGGYRVSVKADGNVTLAEAAAQPTEVAQPIGSFSGYAVNAQDDSNIFVDIALADSKAFVEVGSLLKTTVDFAFDKATGVVTIALGGNFGNLTATYDETNNKLTNVGVDGAAAAMLKNNGSMELVAAAKFWDCNGTTEELQAMFKRRYMSGSWQVDSSNADRFVSYENGICGKAMQRRGYSGGAVAVNLAADMDPVEVSNIGFWVYNPGSSDLTLRMWIYKGAGLTSNAELGSVTAVAGQWTYCRMGFTKASIYNFQIADFNNSGVALVFDNIVLF